MKLPLSDICFQVHITTGGVAHMDISADDGASGGAQILSGPSAGKKKSKAQKRRVCTFDLSFSISLDRKSLNEFQ